MVAGCGPTCVKYTFFTFNFMVFLCGGAVLGLALWARFDPSFQNAVNKHTAAKGETPMEVKNYHIALYVIMGIGGMLLLCGGLGCMGACCESPCLLGTFFTIILILFLAEIAAAIYIFVRKDAIRDDISKWYKETTVDKYYTDNDIRAMLDSTQQQLECCGANGCSDYGLRPPPSCQCGPAGVILGTRPGCVEKLFNTFKRNMTIVAIVAICVVAVELLAMIFSCILCSAIRRY